MKDVIIQLEKMLNDGKFAIQVTRRSLRIILDHIEQLERQRGDTEKIASDFSVECEELKKNNARLLAVAKAANSLSYHGGVSAGVVFGCDAKTRTMYVALKAVKDLLEE